MSIPALPNFFAFSNMVLINGGFPPMMCDSDKMTKITNLDIAIREKKCRNALYYGFDPIIIFSLLSIWTKIACFTCSDEVTDFFQKYFEKIFPEKFKIYSPKSLRDYDGKISDIAIFDQNNGNSENITDTIFDIRKQTRKNSYIFLFGKYSKEILEKNPQIFGDFFEGQDFIISTLKFSPKKICVCTLSENCPKIVNYCKKYDYDFRNDKHADTPQSIINKCSPCYDYVVYIPEDTKVPDKFLEEILFELGRISQI